MKKITAILLSLMLVFAFAACGGGESSDPNAGTYTLTSASTMGITLSPDEVFTGESYIELKDGGNAEICLDGDGGPCEWALDGTDFTITIDGVESVGTLTDGVIVIDLLGMGMDFTFEKTE